MLPSPARRAQQARVPVLHGMRMPARELGCCCRVDRLVDSASNSIVSKLSVVLVEEEDSGDEWERRYCQDIEP